MRKQLAVSLFTGAFLALTAVSAVAQSDGTRVGIQNAASTKVAQASGTPPRESDTGRTSRSDTANTKGANKRGFCPPGQANKPGKGSAFHC
jgi:hypothetical protein